MSHMARMMLVADVCLGAFFASEDKRAREVERERRLALVERWLDGEGSVEHELVALGDGLLDQHPALHWDLEYLAQTGVDRGPMPYAHCFIGNPPFLGGGKISTTFGNAYRDWLGELHDGASGRCDLSAHFFRRAHHFLGDHGGTYGFVATNTISQGDTRLGGLAWLIDHGAVIYNATKNLTWPGDAKVTVSLVHLVKARAA